MGSSLSLLLGLRFSRGRRGGGMVSLISIISTLGIALGVAVLIIGLSAMNGFERELRFGHRGGARAALRQRRQMVLDLPHQVDDHAVERVHEALAHLAREAVLHDGSGRRVHHGRTGACQYRTGGAGL